VEDDRVRWDERYRDRRPAEPSAPDAVSRSADARSLLGSVGRRAADVACGAGGQTLWLAQQGFDVVALDISPAAIDLVRQGAELAGVGEVVDARVHDLDHGLPDDLVDLDVVVCQRFRAGHLDEPIVSALRPGGIAVVTVLSKVGLEIDAGPFHAAPGELVNRLSSARTEVIFHHEEGGQASIVVRRRADDG
jgi:SAM-dependent methyltransferase